MNKKIENPTQPASLVHFGNALRRQRESLGLTLDTLARKTAISKPYLSNIETARAPGPPSEEKIRKLAHALRLPAAQLLAAADFLRAPPSIRKLLLQSPRRPDGTLNLGSILPPSKTQHSALSTQDSTIPLRSLPLINRVAAGNPSEYTDLDYPAGVADQYVPAPDLPDSPLPAAFALKIAGDSMAPDYLDGEIIVLGPPTDLHGHASVVDGDDCVVRLADHENFATTFKKIFFVLDPAGNPTALRLAPINPAYPTRQVPLDQVTGLYPLLYRLVPPNRTRSVSEGQSHPH